MSSSTFCGQRSFGQVPRDQSYSSFGVSENLAAGRRVSNCSGLLVSPTFRHSINEITGLPDVELNPQAPGYITDENPILVYPGSTAFGPDAYAINTNEQVLSVISGFQQSRTVMWCRGQLGNTNDGAAEAVDCYLDGVGINYKTRPGYAYTLQIVASIFPTGAITLSSVYMITFSVDLTNTVQALNIVKVGGSSSIMNLTTGLVDDNNGSFHLRVLSPSPPTTSNAMCYVEISSMPTDE